MPFETWYKLDGLLSHIFDDTISSILNVDFTSRLEQILALWIFFKSSWLFSRLEFIMPWYGYFWLEVLLLLIIYPFLITSKNIKILQRVGSYIIAAPPRTGKSALTYCLWQKHKGRVISRFLLKFVMNIVIVVLIMSS